MALVNCKECGTQISDQASACVKCGAPTSNFKKLPPPVKGPGLLSRIESFIKWTLALLFMYGVYKCTVDINSPRTGAPVSPTSPASKAESAPTGPPLEVQSWRCEKENSFSYVRGEVKNISSTKIDRLLAVAELRNAKGELVKSDDALIEYDPLMPGQTSPFSVITRDNPEIQSCNLSFKTLLGQVVAYKTKSRPGSSR